MHQVFPIHITDVIQEKGNTLKILGTCIAVEIVSSRDFSTKGVDMPLNLFIWLICKTKPSQIENNDDNNQTFINESIVGIR